MKILANRNMTKSLFEDISKLIAKAFLVLVSPQIRNLNNYLYIKIPS